MKQIKEKQEPWWMYVAGVSFFLLFFVVLPLIYFFSQNSQAIMWLEAIWHDLFVTALALFVCYELFSWLKYKAGFVVALTLSIISFPIAWALLGASMALFGYGKGY